MAVRILPVPATEAAAVWPLAEDYVEKGLTYFRGAYLPEDILKMVVNGRAQLWLVERDDKRIIAALVSWLNHYPRKKTVCVPIIGGTEMRTWFRKALFAIESWSKEVGCHGLEGGARRGWGRLANMEEIGVMLWKDYSLAAEREAA